MKGKLQDVCEKIVDCPHSTAPDEGKGYPLIRTPNVGRGRLLLDNVQRVSKEVYDKRNKRATPQAGDIIFAREAPAGNAALICKGQQVCLGQRTVLLRPNLKLVDPCYLVYYLLDPLQQYKLLGSANGSTVAHVNIPTIKNMFIEIPELNVQKRIAQIISSYDDFIENSQKQINLIEEALQRLYKEWFVKLHFPGWKNTQSIKGIPIKWKEGKLQDIAEFKRGKIITKADVKCGSVPVIAGGINPAYYHDEANTKAPVVTISASGANAGYTSLYPVDIFASDCLYIDSESTDYVYYVYCFLKHSSKQIENLQKGSAQPHVYAKDINGLRLLIPNNKYLNLFTDIVSTYFKQIQILQRKCILLSEARDRLLPKLMSGEIEV